MKILVIGCGSIGKRHIKNLLKMNFKLKNIHVVETRKDRIKEINKLGIKNTFNNLNEALKNKYFAGFVCSPTSLHMDQCIKLAKNRINLFIEKPLSSNLKRINFLKKLVKKNKLTVLIAYILKEFLF